MAQTMAEVIGKARSELNKLIGLEISSVLQASRQDEEWLVTMEVVEKHSIPDSMDILATYEARLDENDNLVGFKRTNMRKRIDTETIEE